MLDKLFSFGQGRRTELLGLVYLILQILGIFGVIDPHKVHEMENVILPAAGITLMQKFNRKIPTPPA